MNAVPTIEGKFVQVGDAWFVQGDPAQYVEAAAAGVVQVNNLRNGKVTVRSVIGIHVQNGLQVGPKVHAERASKPAGKQVRNTSKAQATSKQATSSKQQVSAGAPMLSDMIAAVTSAVLAALAAQGIGQAPAQVAPVAPAPVKPISAAQQAARDAFAARAREAAAARKAGVSTSPVTPPPAQVADLPVQTTSDTCVCGTGKVTHVHHAASKLADRTIRTCKQCAKSLTGEQAIAALAS
jgi:hypothetical protein